MANLLAPVHVIGGSGGTSFWHEQTWNGRVLTKIGVWAGGWQLKGIRIWMSGSDSPTTFGSANEGSYAEFSFETGERITQLSLWGNGAGTRSGGIRFFTTRGRKFFHHMTSWGLKTEYPIDVASGICVGIVGRAGGDIDCLGFLFLLTIRSARMVNVRYPTLGGEGGILPVTLDAYNDSNNAATLSKDWTFAGSRTVTTSSSWTLTAGIEVNASVTVQAGIPLVAEVSGTFGWSISVTGSHTSSHEESRTLAWNQSGTLKPGQWVSLLATTRKGTITLPYEGTMEITLQNGAVFRYAISSMYSGVDYTSVDVTNTGSRAVSAVETQSTDQESQEEDQSVQTNECVQECKFLFLE